jgi:hypothetical protein
MVNLELFPIYKFIMGRRNKFRRTRPGIVILGEGPTELFYFKHLKNIFDFKFSIRPRLFNNTCIFDFEKRIDELLESEILIICVFDADVSKRNTNENQKLIKLQKKYEKNVNVLFCDSYPSIEYWFLIHFEDTCPNFESSNRVIVELKRYIKEYQKSEDFLKNQKWVHDMSVNTGSQVNAQARAIKYSSGEASYSNIYKAIKLLSEM